MLRPIPAAAGLSLALLAISCGTPPTFEVVNVDGPAVTVTPWGGASPTEVACGASAEIATASAPSQPWVVAVAATSGGRILLRRSASGDLELIVRSGPHVSLGAPAPSVGPAGGPPCPS